MKPCAICKHARDSIIRSKAVDHVALRCPALPNLAIISDLQINNLGLPSSFQAGLPTYFTLLLKRNSPKTEPTASLKRRLDSAESSEIQQLKKRITELQRGAVGPSIPYARQAFVPSSNEAKDQLDETKS